MASKDYVGSSSFFSMMFDGTFMHGQHFDSSCVRTRLNEIASEAKKVLSCMCSDIKKHERTLKFLDDKNTGVMEKYAVILEELVVFIGASVSPSASTVKDYIRKAIPGKRISADMLEKAYKRIKSGAPMDAVVNDSTKSGSSSVKKEFISVLTDYLYYKSHNSTSNKDGRGNLLGSEGNIKYYAAHVFGSSYKRTQSYSDIMDGHRAMIKFDLLTIEQLIVKSLKNAGRYTDINNLKQFAQQCSRYVTFHDLGKSIDNCEKRLKEPEKKKPKVYEPAMNPINFASEIEQRDYVWKKLNELFVEKEVEGKKLNEWQIAAIMGNMAFESHFSPSNASDKREHNLGGADNFWSKRSNVYQFNANDSIAFGLIQWTNPNRKAALEEFAQGKAKSEDYDVYKYYLYDMDTQLEFLYHETHEKTINKGGSPEAYYPPRYDDFVKETTALAKNVNNYEHYLRECANKFSAKLVKDDNVWRGTYAIAVLRIYGSDDAQAKLMEALGDEYEDYVKNLKDFVQTR